MRERIDLAPSRDETAGPPDDLPATGGRRHVSGLEYALLLASVTALAVGVIYGLGSLIVQAAG